MLHIYSILVPPGDLNMVDCFYWRFLLFAGSDVLVGFKFGEQFFDDPGVEPVYGVVGPYICSVKYDIHESIIYRRRRHDNKVGG